MIQLRQLMFSGVGEAFLKGALMALIGSAVVLLFLAAAGFPLIKAVKRVWFFVMPFEILARWFFALQITDENGVWNGAVAFCADCNYRVHDWL